ncbi:MAG: toast rack family protein [Thermoleophilia bacterium]|nr:toast rack family protein [Thermoleophilia bacterium]
MNAKRLALVTALIAGLLLTSLIAGLLLLSGCGTVKIGVTKEYQVDEPLGGAAVTDVQLVMGAGKLSISPGAPGLASGSIHCNVPEWAPEIKRTEGKLAIRQGKRKGLSGWEPQATNEWRLQLGKAPIRLEVEAGAYEGTYDFSGLTLLRLRIKDGAAKTKVMFNAPNPGQMESFVYETGASTVTVVGLANANCRSVKFKVGAGSYTLDFSGQLRSDCRVDVEAGAGTVKISVPATTPARIVVSGSLNLVSTTGPWVVTGGVYSTPVVGTQPQAKLIIIAVKMSVGSLTLVAE